MLPDFLYTWRGIRKNPGVTVVAVLTLALGIGANTAIFAVLDPLLLRELPVDRPQELVLLGTSGSLHTINSAEIGAFKIYRQHNRVFTGVIAFDSTSGYGDGVDLVRDGVALPVRGEKVSRDYFTVLGVRPQLGHLALAEHEVVLSADCWRREFSSDPRVVGKIVSVRGMDFSIAGVALPEFFGAVVGEAPDVYVALDRLKPEWVTVMARLKPGISIPQAEAAMDSLFQEAVKHSSLPPVEVHQAMTRFFLSPAARGVSDLREPFLLPAKILAGVVAIVLLIACSNVANLLLARGAARSREITVRLAMGASRGRLVRQLLTESAILAALGALAGILTGRWASQLLAASLSTENAPVVLHTGVTTRVLLFSIALLAVTVVVSGLAPALSATRLNLAAGLRVQNANLAGGRSRLSKTLVLTQVALSAALLAGTGLLLRSLVNLETLNTGFNRRNILLVTTRAPANRPKAQGQVFYSQVLERVRQLPGVRAASFSASTPMGYRHYGINVRIPGEEPIPPSESHIFFTSVSPGYFETMQIPLLRGREFRPDDSGVAVINRTMARHYFPGQDAIGKRFQFVEGNRPPFEIIGVAEDAKYHDLREEAYDYAYIARTQGSSGGALEVRAGAVTPALVASLRDTIHSLDPAETITGMRTLRAQVDESIAIDRAVAALTSTFSVLALTLAAIGLYGVLSSNVARRTSEIGVRMALGARPGDVTAMVVGEGLRVALLGVALGLGAAIALRGLLTKLLFGVAPSDPLTYVAAGALLIAVTALASYLPARRAATVDPLVALRTE